MKLDLPRVHVIAHHATHHTPDHTCERFGLTPQELLNVQKAAEQYPLHALYARGLCTSPHFYRHKTPTPTPTPESQEPQRATPAVPEPQPAQPAPPEPPLPPLEQDILRKLSHPMTRKQLTQALHRHKGHLVLDALDALVKRGKVIASRDKTYRATP